MAKLRNGGGGTSFIQGTFCIYIDIFLQTGGGIFASQGLRSVSPPLAFTLDAISYHSIILVHCHLLDFVCYTPYKNDILFLTLVYRIYWNSIYRCCWNAPTNKWGVHIWKVNVIILCHIWVFAVSSRYFLCYPSRAPEFTPDFWWDPCCSYLDFFVLSYCASLRWVPCCIVRCDFRMKTMFASSLFPVLCRRARVFFRLFTLFVLVCV